MKTVFSKCCIKLNIKMLLFTRTLRYNALLLSHLTDEETEAQMRKHYYHLSTGSYRPRLKLNQMAPEIVLRTASLCDCQNINAMNSKEVKSLIVKNSTREILTGERDGELSL